MLLGIWKKKGIISFLLIPLSLIFAKLSRDRYKNIRDKKLSYISKAIVIVVGNINVGGNGKSPLVRYLLNICTEQNLKVGVVSRGYKSKITKPVLVNQDHSAIDVGDEVKSLFNYCQREERLKNVPIAIGVDRVKAVKILEELDLDVIISDDGLQHYYLDRHIEIIVFRGEESFGNQRLLPAGPLREPVSRLKNADFLINSSTKKIRHEFMMQLNLTHVYNIKDGANSNFEKLLISKFLQTNTKIFTLAGIGSPNSFFKQLQDLGFIIEKAYPMKDHQKFSVKLINKINKENINNLPILITDKDMVKILTLKDVDLTNFYVVDYEVIFSDHYFPLKIKQKIADFLVCKV